uniref:CTTNBP2 N-terminal like n=1 Tax=Fundulus heteroclitus TaxID=8078 RepID=A0A3Q2PNE3_FUNHE
AADLSGSASPQLTPLLSPGCTFDALHAFVLTKPELLTLFSILEGELEARDVVIEALKEVFWQGLYLAHKALQETECLPTNVSSLTCFFFSLGSQLEFERSQVRRLEKEQRRISEQLEEERAQHKQLSCALAKECKWASARALEEGHRLTELNRKLDKEKDGCQTLRKELEEERMRALRMEARVEEQLAEFDTEREQLRSRLKREEAHCSNLHYHNMNLVYDQVEELKRKLEEVRGACTTRDDAVGREQVPAGSLSADDVKVEEIEEEHPLEQPKPSPGCPGETNGLHASNVHPEKMSCQNGNDNPSPLQTQASFSHCGPAFPPQTRSPPCTSPVLAKRTTGSVNQGSYQSPYQAGINQRFHAARYKFQGSIEQDSQSQPAPPAASLSPKESSPVTGSSSPEASPVRQMARSTVTQVLSRFTSVQQSAATKHAAPNNSPFGTDYRSLSAPLSPVAGRAAGAVSQGVRSPTISRTERGNPPPIPPKKPGLAQAPLSPAAAAKSGSHFSESPLSGSCGLSSTQEGVKELDMVKLKAFLSPKSPPPPKKNKQKQNNVDLDAF